MPPRADSTSPKAAMSASSETSRPLRSARSLKRMRCGDVCMAVRNPASRQMRSMTAQVDPLPFVPATVTTGHSNLMPMRAIIVCMRSNPISMGLSWSFSMKSSH